MSTWVEQANATFLLAQNWRLVDQARALVHKDIFEPTSGPDNIDSPWKKNMHTEQDHRILDSADGSFKSTVESVIESMTRNRSDSDR